MRNFSDKIGTLYLLKEMANRCNTMPVGLLRLLNKPIPESINTSSNLINHCCRQCSRSIIPNKCFGFLPPIRRFTSVNFSPCHRRNEQIDICSLGRRNPRNFRTLHSSHHGFQSIATRSIPILYIINNKPYALIDNKIIIYIEADRGVVTFQE